MLAIHLLTSTKTNMAALGLMQHLGVNYKAAWRIKHKIMHAMTEREAPRRLSGFVQIDDAYLGQMFEYTSLDAGRCRSRIDDVFAQLFGHSWYHRGQIAALVRAAGGEPAVTDLIFWSREVIGDGAD